MKKFINCGLFTMLIISAMPVLAMEGERVENSTEIANRARQQQAIAQHKLFFHEEKIQNLDDLRHTHQEGSDRGLSSWTKFKTMFSSLIKGPLAIVRDAFERNMGSDETVFTLNDEEKKAFKELPPKEQLQFINEYAKVIREPLEKRLQQIKQTRDKEIKSFNEPIEKLNQEIPALTTKLRSLEALERNSPEIKELTENLKRKNLEKTNLLKKNITAEEKALTKIKNFTALYEKMLNSCADQINPLLKSDIFLRYNDTTHKFEFHKVQETQYYAQREHHVLTKKLDDLESTINNITDNNATDSQERKDLIKQWRLTWNQLHPNTPANPNLQWQYLLKLRHQDNKATATQPKTYQELREEFQQQENAARKSRELETIKEHLMRGNPDRQTYHHYGSPSQQAAEGVAVPSGASLAGARTTADLLAPAPERSR